MPCPMALRTRCVSGSAIASRMLLSRSVCPPRTINSTSFPHCRATSRTTRGKRRNNCSTGTMRIFMTECCRSFRTRPWNAMASANFPRKASFGKRCPNSSSACCNIDFARISSPTRFSTLSIFSASTRSKLSGPVGTPGVAAGSRLSTPSFSVAGLAVTAAAWGRHSFVYIFRIASENRCGRH